MNNALYYFSCQQCDAWSENECLRGEERFPFGDADSPCFQYETGTADLITEETK